MTVSTQCLGLCAISLDMSLLSTVVANGWSTTSSPITSSAAVSKPSSTHKWILLPCLCIPGCLNVPLLKILCFCCLRLYTLNSEHIRGPLSLATTHNSFEYHVPYTFRAHRKGCELSCDASPITGKTVGFDPTFCRSHNGLLYLH